MARGDAQGGPELGEGFDDQVGMLFRRKNSSLRAAFAKVNRKNSSLSLGVLLAEHLQLQVWR